MSWAKQVLKLRLDCVSEDDVNIRGALTWERGEDKDTQINVQTPPKGSACFQQGTLFQHGSLLAAQALMPCVRKEGNQSCTEFQRSSTGGTRVMRSSEGGGISV
eukprot:1137885-Pelagomonas_calceolata.AAC.1